MQHFRKATEIAVPAAQLENWHLSPGAFQRLTPPWERLRILEEPSEIADGTRAVLAMKAGPFWMRWIAQHEDCRPGEGFTDIQVKGPFAHWKHVHRFSSVRAETSELLDDIHYRLPLGFLGEGVAGGLMRGKLQRTFRYRHAVTRMDLERMSSEPAGDGRPMTVLVTGATGMVGRALEAYLRMRGHTVRRVTRNPSRPGDVRWDITAGQMDLAANEKIDAVIHLAGENIAGGRWTGERKRRILESRRSGTRLLCEKICALERKPRVLLSVSGANYYAQGGSEPRDESSPQGEGFLAEVCEVWENETRPAEEAGLRVVRLRLGIVLSPAGGALSKMLPAFKMGLAGRLGSGRQHMPWIALDDVIDIMHRALRDERYSGAVNAVAPQLLSNQDFTRTLARVLHRPAILPLPASALRLALGTEMANETLLADLAISPGKLADLAYPFRYPDVASALRFVLGRA